MILKAIAGLLPRRARLDRQRPRRGPAPGGEHARGRPGRRLREAPRDRGARARPGASGQRGHRGPRPRAPQCARTRGGVRRLHGLAAKDPPRGGRWRCSKSAIAAARRRLPTSIAPRWSLDPTAPADFGDALPHASEPHRDLGGLAVRRAAAARSPASPTRPSRATAAPDRRPRAERLDDRARRRPCRSVTATTWPIPWPMPQHADNVLTVRAARLGPRRDRAARASGGSLAGRRQLVDDPTRSLRRLPAREDLRARLPRARSGRRRASGSPRCATSLSYANYDRPSPFPVALGVGVGISQSGRFLRHFLYQGFNADEAGRKVFDGMLRPHGRRRARQLQPSLRAALARRPPLLGVLLSDGPLPVHGPCAERSRDAARPTVSSRDRGRRHCRRSSSRTPATSTGAAPPR